MGVTVDNYKPTTKPDPRDLPGKIGTRFEKFWKLYYPVITKYQKKQSISSQEFKAAYDDAKKGRDTFYKIAERAQKHQSKEVQQALALAYFHMDGMVDLGRLMSGAAVKYKPKHAERGDNNSVVKGYQQFLKDWRLYKKKLDGDYGDATYEAVKAFQKKHRLKRDGKIGKNTAAKVVELAMADEYSVGMIQKIC